MKQSETSKIVEKQTDKKKLNKNQTMTVKVAIADNEAGNQDDIAKKLVLMPLDVESMQGNLSKQSPFRGQLNIERKDTEFLTNNDLS